MLRAKGDHVDDTGADDEHLPHNRDDQPPIDGRPDLSDVARGKSIAQQAVVKAVLDT